MGSVVGAGIGMIPFKKPGQSETYDVMGGRAASLALQDAGISYDAIEQAYAGYVYGDSTAGQKVLYTLGLSGVPIINVNNNCSTGSTALYLARQAVASGAAECVLAVGFEQMTPGALGMQFLDRPQPLSRFEEALDQYGGLPDLPVALRIFASAGYEHMRHYGTSLEIFAKIKAKASRHAKNNPLALLRNEVTAEEVLASPPIWDGVMTRLMACPPTCGAAAAVIVSERFARAHGIDDSVRIRAQAMTTDGASTFDSGSLLELVGAGMTQRAAALVYEAAGVGPENIDVIELHDCFAQNELITYEGLGLCPVGEAARFVADDDNTYGGQVVVNPSGGLLSKGHPLGATGLAQCYELTHQLRGSAGATQVDDARLALKHNLGLGGACVVTLYERV